MLCFYYDNFDITLLLFYAFYMCQKLLNVISAFHYYKQKGKSLLLNSVPPYCNNSAENNRFSNISAQTECCFGALYDALVDNVLCVLGSRCILSAYLNLDGTAVNDSHAEIIARRAFVKYVMLYCYFSYCHYS